MREARANDGRDRRETRPRDHRGARGVITWEAFLALTLLLVFPGCALWELSHTVEVRWVLGFWVAVCVATWVLYSRDKRKAVAGEWRIPESTLHLAELAGGWPAAFLAQRKLRHKIAKTRYQVAFWLIVFLHQALAFNYLDNWKSAHLAFAFLQRASASDR